MKLLFALAWRNLWRNRRRTLVILIAIVLGAWAMIVMAAFVRGMCNQLFEDTIDNLIGHLQIHAAGYIDDPVIDHRFALSSQHLQKLSEDPRVRKVSRRIRIPAVVVSERESAPVTLVGIEPEAESGNSFIGPGVITQGRYLNGAGDNGILLGKKLAERLETTVNRRIVLMSQDIHNTIADRGFRVVGIFDTGLESTETAYIFGGLQTVGGLVDMGEEISEVAVRLDDLNALDGIVADIQKQLPELVIHPWYEVEPITRMIVEMYDISAIVWNLIVFVAMGFGLVNTLLMAVFERTREFGLLQALGLKPRFIVGQVWCEALLLLIFGLVLGNLISFLTVFALGDGIDVSAFARGMEMFHMQKIIPFAIEAKDLLIANAMVLILGMTTAFYPAWRASRLTPTEALRKE